VRLQIDAESGGATAGEPDRVAPVRTRLLEMASPPAKLCGVIEIEMSGARIRVEPGVELTTLSTVLSALRGGR
jgi:transposase